VQWDAIAARLNAYLIVDALLIALLVTLLPITKDQLTTAFSWTDDEKQMWTNAGLGSLSSFGNPEVAIKQTAATLSAALCSLMLSFTFAMFTCALCLCSRECGSTYPDSVIPDVGLLGVDRQLSEPDPKKRVILPRWYSIFTVSVSISLWLMLIGLVLFAWTLTCAFIDVRIKPPKKLIAVARWKT